jgi:D-alanine-D-alanine ligase
MCTPEEKPHSYVGVMAVADGMSGKDLLDEIVKAALLRYKSC